MPFTDAVRHSTLSLTSGTGGFLACLGLFVGSWNVTTSTGGACLVVKLVFPTSDAPGRSIAEISESLTSRLSLVSLQSSAAVSSSSTSLLWDLFFCDLCSLFDTVRSPVTTCCQKNIQDHPHQATQMSNQLPFSLNWGGHGSWGAASCVGFCSKPAQIHLIMLITFLKKQLISITNVNAVLEQKPAHPITLQEEVGPVSTRHRHSQLTLAFLLAS